MHIFLIRHGESITNAGENYVERIPDHLVPLTPRGVEQCLTAGKWLAEYCKTNNIDLTNATIWRSPFIRTRQTCDAFNQSLNIKTILEDITLTEQQFGLFDALPSSDRRELFPVETAELVRLKSNYGRLYARNPLGESPFDVAIRIQQFIDQLYRYHAKDNVENIFVFAHGTVIRTFLLRWFHYSPEWFEQEQNPENCYIREIDDQNDYGYIYKGN